VSAPAANAPRSTLDTLSYLAESLTAGWELPFRGEIYDYARAIDLQNGYAIKGPFEVEKSRYLIEPFQALRNPYVRQVHVRKAVRVGGSLIADLFVCYIIRWDPGELLWLSQDDDAAGKYMDERFIPGCLKRAPGIMEMFNAPVGRLPSGGAATGRNWSLQRKQFLLPLMSAQIGGLNEGNVQSLGRRYVIIDEAWMSGQSGLINQAIARTGDYPYTKKILIVGQAGTEGDDEDQQWKRSNQAELNFKCPHCHKAQPYEFSRKRDDGSWAGMRWDTNDITCPNGRWNYDRVAESARYECFACRRRIEDNSITRRQLNDSQHYIATRADGEASIVGFHIPQEANADISFGSLVKEYLYAKEQDNEYAYRLPLQLWYQKYRAIPWNPNLTMDIKRAIYEPYDVVSTWPEEAHRFLLVDCQKDFKEFWAVVRAVALSGESRQLARRKLENWDEVAKLQAEFHIKDQMVFIDGGYEQTRCAEECVKHGHVGTITVGREKKKFWFCWTLLKGSALGTFTHTDANGIKDQRIYGRLDFIDPNIGKAKTRQVFAYAPPFPGAPRSTLHAPDVPGAPRSTLHAPDVPSSSLRPGREGPQPASPASAESGGQRGQGRGPAAVVASPQGQSRDRAAAMRVPVAARVPYYVWSNLHVKDILRRHRDQDHAPKFLSLPDESPDTDVWSYTAQMNSEIRDQVYDDRGRKTSIWRPIPRRPNHYWDCEAMFIAVCAIVGIIGSQPGT